MNIRTIVAMKIVFLLPQLLFWHLLFGQISNPPLDANALKRWPYVIGGSLSYDGNYAAFEIHGETVTSDTLIIKSIRDRWEVRIPDVSSLADFARSWPFIAFSRHDSVCLSRLGSDKMEWLLGIRSYRFFGTNSKERFICLARNHELFIWDLSTDSIRKFFGIKDVSFYKDNKSLFLKTVRQSPDCMEVGLSRMDMDSFTEHPIWSSTDSGLDVNLNSITVDAEERRIAFVISRKGQNSVWYFDVNADHSVSLADNSMLKADSLLEIGNILNPGFSHDGKRLFISLVPKKDKPKEKTSVSVDIWNYKDAKLQSQQLYEFQHPEVLAWVNTNAAVVSLEHPQIIRLSAENETIALLKGQGDSVGLVINRGTGTLEEWHWNPASKSHYYIVSTKDGIRRRVSYRFNHFSPGGRYAVGLDGQRQYLYSFDFLRGNSHNLSAEFPIGLRLDEDDDHPGFRPSGLKVAGWMKDDSAIIMYDKYDIWQVDPNREKAAINLTLGYGRRHHIIFRLIGDYNARTYIDDSATYILSAFNEETKESGFFRWRPKDRKSPGLLTMGPYVFEGPYDGSLDSIWLEAKKGRLFIVRRESAAESPNYFATSDFHEFTAISALYPEKKYNWLTSEVIKWCGSQKETLTGVLYKPENFNATKKYPVLINYYERMSQHANQYKQPEYAGDNINIPWFVSHGYIVFTPDIRFKIGHPGASACHSVTTGTAYLLKSPWINGKKIAIAGHSWGGFETNYIIAHCNLYCAAMSASSISDFISEYNNVMRDGLTLQYFPEIDQERIGATLWEKPEYYIENSPVLRANKVGTPLLMMNNKNDAIVAFSQGVEFFLALRRLGKPVWMLQYDGEAHSLDNESAKIDYTLRMTQFFDHYCMDAPMPRWMAVGVPASLKGIDSGLEVK
jgi:dipeptidyl aminopeptidase/acylaminoacyl peptidase